MKNGHFEVGDTVRIGGWVPESDSNYHKRGNVIAIDENGYPNVRMIDEWSVPLCDGIVKYLSEDSWELVPRSFVGVSSLL